MQAKFQMNPLEIPFEICESILGQVVCQHFHTHVLVHPQTREGGPGIGFNDFWRPISQLSSVSHTFRTIVSDIIRTLLAPRPSTEDVTDEQKYLYHWSMRVVIESHRQLRSLINFRRALLSAARFSELPPWTSPLFNAYGQWFLSLQAMDSLFASSCQVGGRDKLLLRVTIRQRRIRQDVEKVFKMAAGGNHRFLEISKDILVEAVIANEVVDLGVHCMCTAKNWCLDIVVRQ
ncbi:hypothetical protein BDN72DRAFT_962331 [Pluteus cervinus]|uniref:Uncharacterized protein n=1 Tax=Pluteus cervinus TaxID=181527 RepID=A0ACD3ALC4_9AGAR|nr:hypothetical protein BDN72DRAFT_962331 [Pluteus cervinus]